jgi:hypothetical protein
VGTIYRLDIEKSENTTQSGKLALRTLKEILHNQVQDPRHQMQASIAGCLDTTEDELVGGEKPLARSFGKGLRPGG